MGEQLPAEPKQKLVIPHHPDWICRRTGREASVFQTTETNPFYFRAGVWFEDGIETHWVDYYLGGTWYDVCLSNMQARVLLLMSQEEAKEWCIQQRQTASKR